MSRPNLNFVIAYILLVGLPVLGLVGVLRAGRTLTAPISVDGVWKVEAHADQVAALPCSGTSFLRNTSLLISQSGRSLMLSFDSGSRNTASGIIDGHSVRASALPMPDYSAEVGCGSNRLLSLNATVDVQSGLRSMVGNMTVEGCSSCGPVGFHAIRQGSAGTVTH
jgi:hypothetical protein